MAAGFRSAIPGAIHRLSIGAEIPADVAWRGPWAIPFLRLVSPADDIFNLEGLPHMHGAGRGALVGDFTYNANALDISGPVLLTKGLGRITATINFVVTAGQVVITLVDTGGNPRPNLSHLKWAFFDQDNADSLRFPACQGSIETTDSSGVLVIPITTALNVGDTGWLIVTNSDGTVSQNPPHLAFSGPVIVS